MQFLDKTTGTVYLVWSKKNKVGHEMHRVHYRKDSRLRVYPGTSWQWYELDALDDLKRLASANRWVKDSVKEREEMENGN